MTGRLTLVQDTRGLDPRLVHVVSGWTGRCFGHAHVCEGSVVRRTVRGITPRHAAARAEKRMKFYFKDVS